MMDRFQRQYILPGFGKAAQEKLRNARVLVVGAGGLGCPALLYLSAAGIGTLGIVDGDVVSQSNLNRQVLFGQQDIGKNKAEAAAQLLRQKYDDVNIIARSEFLRTDNILDILSDYDLILDGADNFPTRYMINDACLILAKPVVYGAIYQYEGQVAIFNTPDAGAVNYRDLFPIPPAANEVPNCNETGVLGVLPGIIGMMMATECIKLLTGLGEMLRNKMLFYSLLNHSSYQVQLVKNVESEKIRPKDRSALQQMNYQDFCGLAEETGWEAAKEMLKQEGTTILVDVREVFEEPYLTHLPFTRITFHTLAFARDELAAYHNVLLFCQSGTRSMKAARLLQTYFPDKNIQSVAGGMLALQSRRLNQ